MRFGTAARGLVAGAALLLPSGATLAAQDTSDTRTPDVHYVPTPHHVVEAMLRLTAVGPDDVVFDLGSGDGRIPIAAAKRFGARGMGIDIDPARIKEANANAEAQGVTDRVRFMRANLFKTDFSSATVVTLYLLPSLNVKLRPTLFRTLKPGTRIASHAFEMGDWQPDAKLEIEGTNAFFWTIPVDVRGHWSWDLKTGAGTEKHTVTFQQRFQKASGSWAGENATVSVPAVRIVGDSIMFRISRPSEEFRIAARVTGDRMEGTIEREGAPAQPFSARRVKKPSGSIEDALEP
ncbi:MAG TPA: class I SAM-dependent methyltransferase [Gemmatimonadales bacterium]|nr:class I SAM-dependent methyltransferase [Gemmatimonadales bacterium]